MNESLNRPPRTKRPPEVKRHVGETIDAYRRVLETRKDTAKPPAVVPRPDKP